MQYWNLNFVLALITHVKVNLANSGWFNVESLCCAGLLRDKKMSVRLQKNLAITDLKCTNLSTYYCKILLMPFFGMNIENQKKKLLSFNFPLFWGPLLLGSTICSLLLSHIYIKNMIICMFLERLRGKNLEKNIFLWKMGDGWRGWTVLGRQCPIALCFKI